MQVEITLTEINEISHCLYSDCIMFSVSKPLFSNKIIKTIFQCCNFSSLPVTKSLLNLSLPPSYVLYRGHGVQPVSIGLCETEFPTPNP